jgi:hypothetical protein
MITTLPTDQMSQPITGYPRLLTDRRHLGCSVFGSYLQPTCWQGYQLHPVAVVQSLFLFAWPEVADLDTKGVYN